MADLALNKQLLDRLTTGISKSLEKRPGICDVNLMDRQPVQRHQLVNWEQMNSCFLPEDLKNFYQMSDGILLKWSVKLDGDNVQSVGRMELNSVNELIKIAGDDISRRNNPSLADLDFNADDEDDNDETSPLPSFNHRSRVFELDPCKGCGKVCLVYRNTKPGNPARNAEIWFLDNALRWHYLSETFSQYFRLMMVHLGLPQWQYAFTDVGLSPQAKQWFNLYGPYRLQLDSLMPEVLGQDEEQEDPTRSEVTYGDLPFQKLDVSKLFKGKSDKKNKSSGAQKKKMGSLNKPMSGGLSGRTGQLLSSNRFR